MILNYYYFLQNFHSLIASLSASTFLWRSLFWTATVWSVSAVFEWTWFDSFMSETNWSRFAWFCVLSMLIWFMKYLMMNHQPIASTAMLIDLSASCVKNSGVIENLFIDYSEKKIFEFLFCNISFLDEIKFSLLFFCSFWKRSEKVPFLQICHFSIRITFEKSCNDHWSDVRIFKKYSFWINWCIVFFWNQKRKNSFFFCFIIFSWRYYFSFKKYWIFYWIIKFNCFHSFHMVRFNFWLWYAEYFFLFCYICKHNLCC